MNSRHAFSSGEIFFYRQDEKFKSGLLLIITLILLFLALFFLYNFREQITNRTPSAIAGIFAYFSNALRAGTPIGLFIVAFSGGLFFFFLPLEIFFLNFLKEGKDFYLLFFIFVSGVMLAQIMNYIVGFRFNRLGKILIPARRFYRLKGLLNHYGPVAIFFVNALPFPSPVFSVVLGAFRYSLIRFLIYTLSGQLVLYIMLIIIYKFFMNALNGLLL